VTHQVVLSLFPGIGLLDRAFEAEGFCVVRGPDLLWGGDIRKFHAPPLVFDGVIGGPPCPDFSKLRRSPPTGYGREMIEEYFRVVRDCQPRWWLLENVPGVPTINFLGVPAQRIDVRGTEVGLRQRRLRHFQFASRDRAPLIVRRRDTPAAVERACVASEGRLSGGAKEDRGGRSRRGWREFCDLMGFEAIDMPGMSVEARYRAVGNGVPLPMGRLIAAAIRDHPDNYGDRPVTLCKCGCAREVEGKQIFALAACRKRMERRRRAFSPMFVDVV